MKTLASAAAAASVSLIGTGVANAGGPSYFGIGVKWWILLIVILLILNLICCWLQKR